MQQNQQRSPDFMEDFKQTTLNILGVARIAGALTSRFGTPGPKCLGGFHALISLIALYIVATRVDGPTVNYPLGAVGDAVHGLPAHRPPGVAQGVGGARVRVPLALQRPALDVGAETVIKTSFEPIAVIFFGLLLGSASAGLATYFIAAGVGHGIVSCYAPWEHNARVTAMRDAHIAQRNLAESLRNGEDK